MDDGIMYMAAIGSGIVPIVIGMVAIGSGMVLTGMGMVLIGCAMVYKVRYLDLKGRAMVAIGQQLAGFVRCKVKAVAETYFATTLSIKVPHD